MINKTNNLTKLIVFSLLFLSCKKNDKNTIATNLKMVKIQAKFDFLPTSTTNQVVFHNFYTLSYNEKYEQAEWVAYELKPSQISKNHFERPYFIQDLAVKTQSASYKNYKKSGYDKGHLCPAADMKFDKNAFDDTFYTSNISPQKHYFNSGIWNILEGKVRYWATKYNGVYVVTGGVLTHGLPTIGFENIAVPKYFYKVLLTKTNEQYKMIAFLLPNEPSDKPLYQYVISVDKLEQLTGIDFYPSLPDSIEKKLESIADYKEWSF